MADTGRVNAAKLPELEPGWGAGDCRREVVLRHHPYQLRPLRPDDQERLQEFFYSHSQETIWTRYGCMISQMTPQRAHDLVSVDQTVDLALGIFDGQGAREILHAVGRYCLAKDRASAEVAFVVRENMRRCGMATTLLRCLAEVAHQRGLDRLIAYVLHENEEMRSLFARYSPDVLRQPGAGWLRYALSADKILQLSGRPRRAT